MRRRKSGGDVHGAPGLPRIIGWARSNVAKSGRIRADVENSSHEDFKGLKLKGDRGAQPDVGGEVAGVGGEATTRRGRGGPDPVERGAVRP